MVFRLTLANNMEYSCFHFGLSRMAEYYNRDYEMTFLELWGFFYEEGKKGIEKRTIGERLRPSWFDNQVRRKYLLEKYHQLTYEVLVIKGEDDMASIASYLQEKPLVAYIDTFDCPWLPYYHKQHCEHSIVIEKNENGIYRFYDQYCHCGEYDFLTEENIYEYCKKIFIFSTILQKDLLVQKEDYLIELKNTMELFENSKALDRILEFSRDMLELHLINEIPNSAPEASILLRELKFLSQDRHNMILGICYIETKIGEHNLLDAIKMQLEVVSKRYEALRSNIMKGIFLKSGLNIGRMKNDLDKLCASETELLRIMKKLSSL